MRIGVYDQYLVLPKKEAVTSSALATNDGALGDGKLYFEFMGEISLNLGNIYNWYMYVNNKY